MSGSEPATDTQARALPSGTVTFAFTDIEGSTARWERDPIAMASALRRHDAIVRDAIARHDGHVFKTVGDAFCAVFGRAHDAVAAVASLQASFAATDFAEIGGLRVRCAIHTGTADERDADFFGPTVNRVARLLGAAHGGQALVSERTHDLVRSTLPHGASLRDLGEHRLKDLVRPERIYQLVAPGCVRRFDPLRTISTVPNNLPSQVTALLGREAEVAAVSALLAEHRFVTIVGSGGIGKTRTSLQVGADAFDVARDGVWFVELAPLASGAYVPAAIATAMNAAPADGDDPHGALGAAIGRKAMLLVLDNCEHLLEATGRTVGALLRACPNLRVLASSRERLGIAGETTFRLPSLPTPRTTDVGAREAGRFTAVTLFVERAVAVDDRFALTDANAAAVADVCRRLDGIPLAIELAAARIKILRPGQLRERLDERLRLLVGGGRDLLPRQRTLRALIDWSYDLLDHGERRLFRRLSVFVDGFTMEAAQALGGFGDGRDDARDAFTLLASLVEKSLVIVDADDDAVTRYRTLESTRAYAAEKLALASEVDGARSARLRYLRDVFVRERTASDRAGDSTRLVALLVTERENVRNALDASVAPDDVRLGAALLAAIGDAWTRVGGDREGVERNASFVERLGPGDDRLAATLWRTRSLLEENRYRYDAALDAARRAVAHARDARDASVLAPALVSLAGCRTQFGAFDEATAHLAEAARIMPEDDVLLRYLHFGAKAYLAAGVGDLDAAATAHLELRAFMLAHGHANGIPNIVVGLAEVEHRRGLTDRAATLVRDVLPTLRADPNVGLFVQARTNLANYELALDRRERAGALLRDVLLTSDLAPHDVVTTIALEAAALAIALARDVERAARLAAHTAAVFARGDIEREYTERITRARLDALLAAALEPHALATASADGAALTPDEAVDLALASPAIGETRGPAV